MLNASDGIRYSISLRSFLTRGPSAAARHFAYAKHAADELQKEKNELNERIIRAHRGALPLVVVAHAFHKSVVQVVDGVETASEPAKRLSWTTAPELLASGGLTGDALERAVSALQEAKRKSSTVSQSKIISDHLRVVAYPSRGKRSRPPSAGPAAGSSDETAAKRRQRRGPSTAGGEPDNDAGNDADDGDLDYDGDD